MMARRIRIWKYRRRGSFDDRIRCDRIGIVDIAKDVLRGIVAKSSVHDGVDDRAHLVPWVLIFRHRSQNNDDGRYARTTSQIDTTIKKLVRDGEGREEEEDSHEGGWGGDTTTCTSTPTCRPFWRNLSTIRIMGNAGHAWLILFCKGG
jgi:hypothetical protein